MSTDLPLSQRNFIDVDKASKNYSPHNQYDSKFVGEETCPIPRKKDCKKEEGMHTFRSYFRETCWKYRLATLISEALGVMTVLFVVGAVIASFTSGSCGPGCTGDNQNTLVALTGALAIGFATMASYTAFSAWHVQLSPTVTLMLLFYDHKPSIVFALFRIAGQLIGGFIAMLALYIIFDHQPGFDHISPTLGDDYDFWDGLVAEIIGSFIIHLVCLVIWVIGPNMISMKAFRWKKALILGFTLFAVTVSLWNVTGSSFNHVRWLPSAAITGVFGSHWWIYPVGPIVGAILAGLAFEFLMLIDNVLMPIGKRYYEKV